MKTVLDRSLFAPKIKNYSVSNIWRLYGSSPAPCVPSPCRYMNMTRDKNAWLGFSMMAKEGRRSKRAKAYLRIWANIVQLIRGGMTEWEAVTHLDEAYGRAKKTAMAMHSTLDMVSWAEQSQKHSGLIAEKDVKNWYWA